MKNRQKLSIVVFIIVALMIITSSKVAAISCGKTTVTTSPFIDCSCDHTVTMFKTSIGQPAITSYTICCGWLDENDQCVSSEITPIPTPTDAQAIEIPEVTKETLDSFNPLKQFSSDPDRAELLSTPGGILSELLRFIFPIAGIILFIILLFAGIKIMTGAGNSQAVESGKQMIISAAIGFVILFAAYWIAQLLQAIFGINILGN